MLLKIIAWNINGLRAALKSGALNFIQDRNPDILCLQEIKVDAESTPELDIGFSTLLFNSAQRKGYSGTAIFSKIPPLKYRNVAPFDSGPAEGRIIESEFPFGFLVNVYVPNSGVGLRRLSYRSQVWDPAFRDYLSTLAQKKPVIVCGDFNVAHQEIDIERPNENRFSSGFTDIEREGFTKLLASGFIDIFRERHPNEPKHYTWWSQRTRARERNIGWRIDYFLVSPQLPPAVQKITILKDVIGSDHAPVELLLKIQ